MKAKEAAKLLREASRVLEQHYDECEGYEDVEYTDVALLRQLATRIELLDDLAAHSTKGVTLDAKWAVGVLLGEDSE
jgi:hypothetical protein